MISAVLFDLDGVLVSTDEFHYLGWQQLADEEAIFFDRQINERLRGVSRMESLTIILERANRAYTQAETLAMAARKNSYYRQLLEKLSPRDILPGVNDLLTELRARSVKMAIGSSSRNCPHILERIGLAQSFDAVVDGNQIINSKPDPEVFLVAARKLAVQPCECLVVEDAEAGVTAGLAGAMKVMAVGAAANDPRAHLRASDLRRANVDEMLAL